MNFTYKWEERLMRKLLVSVLVIDAVPFRPCAAQAPLHGLKTGYVAATYTGEVLPDRWTISSSW